MTVNTDQPPSGVLGFLKAASPDGLNRIRDDLRGDPTAQKVLTLCRDQISHAGSAFLDPAERRAAGVGALTAASIAEQVPGVSDEALAVMLLTGITFVDSAPLDDPPQNVDAGNGRADVLGGEQNTGQWLADNRATYINLPGADSHAGPLRQIHVRKDLIVDVTPQGRAVGVERIGGRVDANDLADVLARVWLSLCTSGCLIMNEALGDDADEPPPPPCNNPVHTVGGTCPDCGYTSHIVDPPVTITVQEGGWNPHVEADSGGEGPDGGA